MKPTIVLARSYQEFREYVRERGGKSNDRAYVYGDWPRMAGIEASGVVEIGTFHRLDDARKLRQIAETRVRP